MNTSHSIRPMKPNELRQVTDIWLNANLDAHAFIPADYWHSQLPSVSAQIAQAEIYVCESAGEIQGFIGLSGSYIAGIFVKKGARSNGIGTALLSFVKTFRDSLSLSVYCKNTAAIRFYQRNGFHPGDRSTDQETNEPELCLTWNRLTEIP